MSFSLLPPFLPFSSSFSFFIFSFSSSFFSFSPTFFQFLLFLFFPFLRLRLPIWVDLPVFLSLPSYLSPPLLFLLLLLGSVLLYQRDSSTCVTATDDLPLPPIAQTPTHPCQTSHNEAPPCNLLLRRFLIGPFFLARCVTYFSSKSILHPHSTTNNVLWTNSLYAL